ncbi:MAG: hypothetical protein IT332_10030 [Ardenticatenales bacterium]|nr:hypothetical protein [Ardenticatenales bacterium]
MTDRRSAPSIMCAIAAAFFAVLLVLGGILLCRQWAPVAAPAQVDQAVTSEDSPSPEPGDKGIVQFIFGNGGAITDLGDGVVEVKFFVDQEDGAVGAPPTTAGGAIETPPPPSAAPALTGTVQTISPITIRVTRAQAEGKCLSTETLARVELNIRPATKIPYPELMVLNGSDYEVIFGDDPHEMLDLKELCTTGAWMALGIRRTCLTSTGQERQRDSNNGMLVAYMGCYMGQILQLGDPSGIIDQPLVVEGTPTCRNGTYQGQTVTLREVQGWTEGVTNTNGAAQPSGACYSVDNHSGDWQWHTTSQVGSATVVTPDPKAQPENSMQLKANGSFGFYASASKCYFVEFTNGVCTYYSDIVTVPPDPDSSAQPRPPHPGKLITQLNLHLPTWTNCPVPATSCP